MSTEEEMAQRRPQPSNKTAAAAAPKRCSSMRSTTQHTTPEEESRIPEQPSPCGYLVGQSVSQPASLELISLNASAELLGAQKQAQAQTDTETHIFRENAVAAEG